MKWFYAFNTQDEENESFDGNEFIVDNISQVEFDELLDRSEAQEDKKRSQRGIVSLWRYCGIAMLLFVFTLLDSLFSSEKESLWNSLIKEAPYLLFVFGGCAAVFVVGFFMFMAQGKFSNAREAVLFTFVGSRPALDGEGDDNFEERLGIPENAYDVDILSFDYDDDTDMSQRFTDSTNWEVKIFADEDNLYISDLESKFSFPRSELKRITTVRAKMSMLFWNKKISYKIDPYDRFKITKIKGKYEISTYHVLEVEHEGELWGIVFPCYELSTFQLLTGLTAEY